MSGSGPLSVGAAVLLQTVQINTLLSPLRSAMHPLHPHNTQPNPTTRVNWHLALKLGETNMVLAVIMS